MRFSLSTGSEATQESWTVTLHKLVVSLGPVAYVIDSGFVLPTLALELCIVIDIRY